MSSPALVLCAHGTDDADGQRTVAEIAAETAERLPGVLVETAYVDVQQPGLPDTCDALVAQGHDVVVVPLLLSTGFHIQVDVAEAVRRHPGRVVSTGPLGPHPKLAAALVDRVALAGVGEGALVIGIAGSSKPGAEAAATTLVGEVAALWPGPVSAGFISACEPRVAQVIESARGEDGSTVTCASYLIGPGFFQRQLLGAGADVTSAPLGAHPLLIDLVVRRYRHGIEELDASSPTHHNGTRARAVDTSSRSMVADRSPGSSPRAATT